MTDIMKVGDTINAKEVMSSLEIAELTGKRHADVMRDIRNIMEQLDNEAERNFALSSYLSEQNKELPMYILSKKGSLCLASGYDAKLRMAIINRWEELELEKKSSFKVPTSFAEALQLAANQAREIEEKQKLLEQQAPKVDYYDKIVERGKSLNFRDTAKLFGYKESAFIYFLLEKGYVYRDRKNKLMPTAEYVGKYFEVKEFVRGEHNGVQTLITQKGREHFYKLIQDVRRKMLVKLEAKINS